MRQLYVNGKLARCMDEYHVFKRCLMGKLNAEVRALPRPARPAGRPASCCSPLAAALAPTPIRHR